MDGSNSNSISTHLGAVKSVVELTKALNVPVSDAIRRAIIWQDLYSCLFVGTTRVLSHRDYEEIRPEALSTPAPVSLVPLGLDNLISCLPREFTEVMIDLNALCNLIDTRCGRQGLSLEGFPIDTFQYSLESRLVDLLSQDRRSGNDDPLLQVCIFASFFVTYTLSTGIWEGCFIPDWCATQVMIRLEDMHSDSRWRKNHYKNLLLWLLFVSGTMLKRDRIRMQAMKMIRNCYGNFLDGSYDDWDQLRDTLSTYIWSSHSMEPKVRRFWQELHSRQPRTGYFEENINIMHIA